MKEEKIINENKVYIDTRTQKGVFATGFTIKTNGDLALIDFCFDTPENITTVVSRVIMPLDMLKALENKIKEKNEKVVSKK